MKGNGKIYMKHVCSFILAEILYLVSLICKWVSLVSNFIAYLYLFINLFFAFLHFTGLARVWEHNTAKDYIFIVCCLIVLFCARSILEYVQAKAINAHYKLLNY